MRAAAGMGRHVLLLGRHMNLATCEWVTSGNIIETGTDSYRLAPTRARTEHNAG
jgi:hypothetical protein